MLTSQIFGPGLLRESLAPYLQILARAQPEDTVMAPHSAHPVFMMDAEPRLWQARYFFDSREFDESLVHVIESRRPRFVILFDMEPDQLMVPAPILLKNYRLLLPGFFERTESVDGFDQEGKGSARPFTSR